MDNQDQHLPTLSDEYAYPSEMSEHDTCVKVSAIVAKAKNGVIGLDGDMPWRMPEDLKYFREQTMGKPVIMGRVTWESLPGALKGRHNLILTRDRSYSCKGAEVFHSPEDILARAIEIADETESREVMIIGGGQVYDLMLKYCSTVYVTRIVADLEGDTVFPNLVDGQGWVLRERSAEKRLGKDEYRSQRAIYDRAIDAQQDLFKIDASNIDAVSFSRCYSAA